VGSSFSGNSLSDKITCDLRLGLGQRGRPIRVAHRRLQWAARLAISSFPAWAPWRESAAHLFWLPVIADDAFQRHRRRWDISGSRHEAWTQVMDTPLVESVVRGGRASALSLESPPAGLWSNSLGESARTSQAA